MDENFAANAVTEIAKEMTTTTVASNTETVGNVISSFLSKLQTYAEDLGGVVVTVENIATMAKGAATASKS